MLSPEERTACILDRKARALARRCGLIVRKSRIRNTNVDNWGGYMLVDPHTNVVEAGSRWDLSAQQVIDYCTPD